MSLIKQALKTHIVTNEYTFVFDFDNEVEQKEVINKAWSAIKEVFETYPFAVKEEYAITKVRFITYTDKVYRWEVIFTQNDVMFYNKEV